MNSSADHGDVKHIDLSVLDLIRQQMPGRPEVVNRIIGSFLRSSPGLLENLRAALFVGDPEEVRKAAHSMKSSNAQIGANQLANMCHQLEILASMGQLVDTAMLFEELEREYHHVEKELGLLLALSHGQEGR